MKHKKLFVATLATSLALASSITSLAGEWQKDNIGWWWQEDDGSYPVNEWKQVNSKWYYFDASGYMVANRWIGNYYLGADGAMLVSTTTPDGYRVGVDGAWIPDVDNSTELFNNKINELKINEGIENFEIRDLNKDGNKELYAFDFGYARAWSYKNGSLIELAMPEDIYKYNFLSSVKDVFCTEYEGSASFSAGKYYRLNSNNRFEFITGLSWTNGAWNGLGRDAYYITDSNGNHIKEISEEEFSNYSIN